MQGLGVFGDLPDERGFALGVSADGSVVVGSTSSASISETNRAFRWTEADDLVDIGRLPGTVSAIAYGVSADGSKIVGSNDYPTGEPAAFLWTASEIIDLGDLPGGLVQGVARAISADGTTVVGTSHAEIDGETGPMAFRWTESAGMVGLGDLPGGDVESGAVAVSSDGSVIVGHADAGNAFNGDEAMIWTFPDGIQRLQKVLTDEYGLDLDLEGWFLSEATGVSEDGRTITGFGLNPDGEIEGWLAAIPELSTILGDMNKDGRLDGLDVDLFVRAVLFEPSNLRADLNGDGTVSGLDVAPFAAVVIAGTTQVIPEPSALLLSTITLLGLLCWRRKGR